MNDMSQVIIPKSDQINADDLISGPMTITIRDVQISGGQEQPVSIFFDGSDKAFRPCKSMSRVLVYGWGADAKAYIGRSLTLYRDPEVKWGGMAVGGIRISHMSHIDSAQTMVLAVTKGSRKPYKVMPLVIDASKPTDDKAQSWTDKLIATIKTTAPDQIAALVEKHSANIDKLKTTRPELHSAIMEAAMPIDDGFDEGTTHPASALADKIITAAQTAETIIDLTTIEKDAAEHIASMPDEMATVVTGAFETARARLKEPAQ